MTAFTNVLLSSENRLGGLPGTARAIREVRRWMTAVLP